MNSPLQSYKILKGKDLVNYLMNRFDYSVKEATTMMMRMPIGLKVWWWENNMK